MTPHKLLQFDGVHCEAGYYSAYGYYFVRGKKRYVTGASSVSAERAIKDMHKNYVKMLQRNHVTREVRESDTHQHDREAIENFERDR